MPGPLRKRWTALLLPEMPALVEALMDRMIYRPEHAGYLQQLGNSQRISPRLDAEYDANVVFVDCHSHACGIRNNFINKCPPSQDSDRSLRRYDTRCYFNMRSKADISQLNLPHGTDN